MPDAVAYPVIGLIAAGLIALAMVWPQGEGVMSPGPFAVHHYHSGPTSLRGPVAPPAKAAATNAAVRP